MIRRSPAERYIKYLLLHPQGYDNAQIKEMLEDVQLDYVSDRYVERLRGGLRPPTPFYPTDVRHSPSQRFLLEKGLTWVFRPDVAGQQAFKILERPRVKEFVEAMLTSGAPTAAIAAAATRQRGFSCNALTIARYKSFFWDTDLLDSTELRALLQLRVDSLASHPDAQVQAQHGAVKRAYYNDARRAAAELPFSPLSALVAQMRMGLMPTRVDLAKVIEQGMNFAAIRVFEAASNNNKGDAVNAFNYALTLEKLAVVHEKVTKPEEDLHNELARIALRTEDVSIPSLQELSGGNHTIEVTPEEATYDIDRHDRNPGDDG